MHASPHSHAHCHLYEQSRHGSSPLPLQASSHPTGPSTHPCCSHTGSAGATPFPSLAAILPAPPPEEDCPHLSHHRKCAPTHSRLPDPRVSPPKRTKTRTENKIKPTIHGQLSGQNKSREQLPAEGLLPLGEHRPAPVVARAFPSGRGIHPVDPSAGGFNVWRGCTTQHAVRSVCQNCWQE